MCALLVFCTMGGQVVKDGKPPASRHAHSPVGKAFHHSFCSRSHRHGTAVTSSRGRWWTRKTLEGSCRQLVAGWMYDMIRDCDKLCRNCQGRQLCSFTSGIRLLSTACRAGSHSIAMLQTWIVLLLSRSRLVNDDLWV